MTDRPRVIRRTTEKIVEDFEGCPCAPTPDQTDALSAERVRRLQGLVGDHDVDGSEPEEDESDDE